MYQYPMLKRVLNRGRQILLAGLGLLLLLLGLEWAWLVLNLWHFHPIAAYVLAGISAVVVLALILRYRLHLADHQTLRARGFRTGSRASHRDLKHYCRYLAHYLTRLSDHPVLQEETGRQLRQQAADIDDVLASHPLNDDLYRAIQQVEEILLPAAFEELETERNRLTQVKIRAVIEDINQPPFPVIVPLVMAYHQLTLASLVVDCFVHRPSLSEYLLVLRDVWRVLTQGDFIRLGQRLFEGVYVNCPPLGQAGNDLGQALASVWLTHTVSNAASQRCRTLHSWSVKQGIAWMEGQTVPTLNEIREEWTRSLVPLLKIRIRHNAPPGAEDTNAFTDAAVRGITKAIDTIVQGLTAQRPASAHPAPRPRPPAAREAAEPAPAPARTVRRRRKRRRRARGNPFRLFGLFSQKVRYRNGPEN